MRRRRALAACCVCAAAWVACGPITGAPPSNVPVNTCPDNPCAAYTEPSPLVPAVCSGGACVSNSAFDFFLVVSLPESSFFAPGVTMAIPYSQLLASAPSSNVACQPPACVQLPQLVQDTGSLIVSNGVAASANEDLGNGGQGASLPVQVEYYPQWPFPTVTTMTGPATFVDAPAAGLPVLSTRATITSPGLFLGPNGTSEAQWRASLPPGEYERDIVPYDDAFPPEVDMISTFALPDPHDVQSGVDGQGAAHQLTVTSELGTVNNLGQQQLAEVDLTGFDAYLRDTTTLRRVSSRATFVTTAPFTTFAPAPVYLNTYANLPLTGVRKLEIVIEPPAGSPTPTFTTPIVLPALNAKPVPFPSLPAPVAVSGVVQAPDGTPLEADLVIDNAASTGTGGSIVGGDGSSQLHFETTGHAGTDGSYAVMLPPGTYDVRIIPVVGAAAAANDASLSIDSQPGQRYPVAAGQTLTAAKFGSIQGIATVADGRPLAGATVNALPSASLAATTDPRRWPRAQSTTTAADGSFTLTVDPGVFDVLVEPANGTSFPIVTASNRSVAAAASVVLGPMAVPAPISIGLTMHDPSGNAIIAADVRAFAVAAPVVPPAGGGPAPSLEIGHFMTDVSGNLQLLVVPPH